jgi:hypothetical protein
MDQVIPVKGAEFVNDNGTPAHEGTTRRNIHTSLDDIDPKCCSLKKQKRDSLERLNSNDHDLTLKILRLIDELKVDTAKLKADIRELKERSLKQTFSMNVTKNYRYRTLGIDQVDVPFIKPEIIPQGTTLSQITSVEQIQNLTVSKIKMYLQAYDITFANNWPRRNLKELLRNELGFTRDNELAVELD